VLKRQILEYRAPRYILFLEKIKHFYKGIFTFTEIKIVASVGFIPSLFKSILNGDTVWNDMHGRNISKISKMNLNMLDSLKIHRMMKQELSSCRAVDNAKAARCQSFAARWARVFNRPSLYSAAHIENNEYLLFKLPRWVSSLSNWMLVVSPSNFCWLFQHLSCSSHYHGLLLSQKS